MNFGKCPDQFFATSLFYAFHHLDSPLGQNPCRSSLVGRIRITRANDHPFDTRLDKSRGTGAGPALGAARLKGKINGGAPGCIHAVPTHRILKSFYLGMRLPG